MLLEYGMVPCDISKIDFLNKIVDFDFSWIGSFPKI